MSTDAPTGVGPEGPPPSTASEHDFTTRTTTRVPFRLKVALVWVGIFAVLAVGFALSGFDTTWMKENWPFIVKGIWITIFITICCAVAPTWGGLPTSISYNTQPSE